MGYYNDFRVAFQRPSLELDGEKLPSKFELCPVCSGRGTHVNPSIDCDGLTCDDFNEDPDFAEAYMGGMYDVTCYGCEGKRVIEVVDESRMDAATLQQYRVQEREEAEFRALRRAELARGA